MFEEFLIKWVGTHYAHVVFGIGIFVILLPFLKGVFKRISIEFMGNKFNVELINRPGIKDWCSNIKEKGDISFNKGNTKLFKKLFPLKPLKKLEKEEFIYFAKSYLWKHEFLTKNDLDVFEKMMGGDDDGVHPETWEQYWNNQDHMDINFKRIRKIVKQAKKAEQRFNKELKSTQNNKN